MKNALNKEPFVRVAKHKRTIEKTAFACLAGAVFLYLVVKATCMPFVLDEATTFVEFVQTGDIWPADSRWTTNNHLLNTGLVWVCFKLFGDAEFLLRIPNLLAFLIYSVAAFSLLGRIKSGGLKIIFAVGMMAPMYLIDFFAMARGYGLSFAFLLFACAKWLEVPENKKAYWLAEGAFFLAILANLSVVYAWPAFWLLSGLRDYFLGKQPIKKVLLWRIFSLVLVAPHVAYALVLRENFTFDLGVDISIYQSFYSHIVILFSSADVSAMALLGVLLFISLLAIFSRHISATREALFFVGLVCVTVAIYLMLYLVMHAPLPISRVSLHLFVLWFPAVIFVADAMQRQIKHVAALAISALVFFMLADFSRSFSVQFHKDFYWQREQLHSGIIETLKGVEFQEKTISANFFLRGNTIYQHLKDPDFPFVNTYNFPQKNAQYVLVSQDEENLVPANFKAVKRQDRFVILKNTKAVPTDVLADTAVVATVPGRGFTVLAAVKTTAKTIVANVHLSAKTADQKSFLTLLCIEVKNQKDETLFWQKAPLNHYVYAFNGEEININFLAENLPEGAKNVSVYVWSQRMKTIDELTAKTKILVNEFDDNLP